MRPALTAVRGMKTIRSSVLNERCDPACADRDRSTSSSTLFGTGSAFGSDWHKELARWQKWLKQEERARGLSRS